MFRTSHELGACWVHQYISGIGINDADGVWGSVDEIAIFLLACAQLRLRAIAFDRNPCQVRRLLHHPEIMRTWTLRFATVNAERSQDFSVGRQYWIRPGSSQPMT